MQVKVDQSTSLSTHTKTTPETANYCTYQPTMDKALQTALSAGLSSVSGYHSNKPKRVDPELAGKNVLPQSFNPTPKDRISFPAAKGEVKASYISIGGWPWGDKATWHYDESEWIKIQEAWQALYDAGINFIDTAESYGNGESEKILGDLIKGLPRENVVVQTKYFSTPLKATNFTHPIDAPIISLKASLERMGLDYVDIYLVHGPIHPQSISTIAEGMAKCVEEGLTRAVGVANYDDDDVLKMRDELKKYNIPLATNQCEFNVLRRYPEVSGNIKRCKDNDIVFQSYSSLAQGRLSGKYSAENPPPKEYRFSSYDMKDIEPTLVTLREIAEKRGKSVASVSLNYNISKGVVPVVGIRNVEQAKAAIDALGWRLNEDEVVAIDKVSVEGRTSTLWQQG
ncbi:putative aldo/keto reductase [Colletotrichum truncatum]|uniref:Aldo/keto reductase n=1 Tax=Colletotrichum truncatum TaxID=5467 RepID=A0ACC3YNL2_COLTU|nr:putative aldo/keto reductase [Colletotrichum truncatum]XP_036581157.1 putative aldo/keto reductase [Colletotrichum truncatum]KAF6780601.1 putative aldo/keto reductase [Colletotrichum truncatum]KAF6789425.1 putative aldo/keto reductase [Colletotrichum truncatum]